MSSEDTKEEFMHCHTEDPKCLHLIYQQGYGYCLGRVRDKEFRCEHADYNAHSYFPPCAIYKYQYGEQSNY